MCHPGAMEALLPSRHLVVTGAYADHAAPCLDAHLAVSHDLRLGYEYP